MNKKVSANWKYPVFGKVSFPFLVITLLITLKFLDNKVKLLIFWLYNHQITTDFKHQYQVIYITTWIVAIIWIAIALLFSDIFDNRQLLKDFIKKNKLFLVEKNNDNQEEIIDSVKMRWFEDDKNIIIRAYKTGGPIDNLLDDTIGNKLQVFIKKEFKNENIGLDYIDYVFEKEKDERLIL